MKYALIEAGVVKQTQPNPGTGFVEVPDAVTVGMVQQADEFITPVDFDSELRKVIQAINTACKAAIEGGFISNALGQDYTYDSELEDQVNISGNVQMGTDVLHKRTDGNGVAEYEVHTASEMRLVGEHLVAHKLAQLTKAGGLKVQAAAAAAAEDLDALQAITWS